MSPVYLPSEINLGVTVTVIPLSKIIEQEPLIDELVHKEVLGSLRSYPLQLPLVVMPIEKFLTEYVGAGPDYVKENRESAHMYVVLRGCNRSRAAKELGYSLIDCLIASDAFHASSLTEKVRVHSVEWEKRMGKLRNSS